MRPWNEVWQKLGLACCIAWLGMPAMAQLQAAAPEKAPSASEIERGAYLVRIGNCMGCHTVAGGAAMAGGRRVETAFGTFFTSNLTPHPEAGIGRWSAEDFYRALHEGISRDGRLLYPAFPYPEFTRLRREDSDAIYAYLQTLPAVEQAPPPHALRFPYNQPMALRVWRWISFRPARWQDDPQGDAQMQRGAYLAQVVAHCVSCHTPRNRLGALRKDRLWQGSPMPAGGWHAPALDDAKEGGVGHWSEEQVARYLRTGRAESAVALGPMAEIVFEGTQYLTPEDAAALARYLVRLPQRTLPAEVPAAALHGRQRTLGQAIYEKHCQDCHGAQGEGQAGRFAALAGNAAVQRVRPDNVVQMVLYGGYAPATKQDPYPHGMSPFFQQLRDEEVAAVVSYVRSSWGNRAPAVEAQDVYRLRERQAQR